MDNSVDKLLMQCGNFAKLCTRFSTRSPKFSGLNLSVAEPFPPAYEVADLTTSTTADRVAAASWFTSIRGLAFQQTVTGGRRSIPFL